MRQSFRLSLAGIAAAKAIEASVGGEGGFTVDSVQVLVTG
jgi:hypothetical protein